MEDKSFLGRGWSFPPDFQNDKRTTRMSEYEEDIRQSLIVLFSTRVGERFNRNYGCNLADFVFEQITSSVITRMKDEIERAILLFEPRISLKKVNINTSREPDGILLIELDYLIRQTNTDANFVYPFYLQNK